MARGRGHCTQSSLSAHRAASEIGHMCGRILVKSCAGAAIPTPFSARTFAVSGTFAVASCPAAPVPSSRGQNMLVNFATAKLIAAQIIARSTNRKANLAHGSSRAAQRHAGDLDRGLGLHDLHRWDIQ